MRQSVINSYIAPLQKLLIRTDPEHSTAKESFNEQEMSQNGLWGKLQCQREPISEDPTTKRRLHRGGLVRCGYLRTRGCPQGRTSFTIKACFEDVLSE